MEVENKSVGVSNSLNNKKGLVLENYWIGIMESASFWSRGCVRIQLRWSDDVNCSVSEFVDATKVRK